MIVVGMLLGFVATVAGVGLYLCITEQSIEIVPDQEDRF